MGSTKVVLAVAILGILFVSLATANGNNSSSYILKLDDREELIRLVNEAEDFMLTEGKDKALQVLSDPNGKFVNGDLYVYAMDANGTNLAQIGWYAPDINGVDYAKIYLNLMRRGSGFAYTVMPNPAYSNVLELKLNYLLKADENLYLGSGMYLPGPAPIFSNESRKDLVAFVESAREFALDHTKDEAMKAFNDPKGKFVKGELYIIAYDFNGTRLAHPYMPETIGENALNVTDPNGVDQIRNMRDLAANWGDGLFYYIWPNPAHSNAMELKLCYVTKVNDDWFLASGVYLPGARS
jgi:polar amino acid transport system substrate-binding protein